MYANVEEMNVKYIQFDKDIKYHVIKTNTTLNNEYDEWYNSNCSNNHLFVALVKWFMVDDNTLIICLSGLYENGVQYENQ